MRRLKIGFDVDGVLADFSKRFTELANRKFNKTVNYKDQTVWDYNEFYTPEEIESVWSDIKATTDFWFDLERLHRIPLWVQNQHQLWFITSRVPVKGMPTELQTAGWLHWLQDINYPQVIVVNQWHEKPTLYKALHLDAFIDDKPETVTEMRKRHQNCYVMDQPYNSKVEVPEGYRVHNVEEYIKHVEETLGSE